MKLLKGKKIAESILKKIKAEIKKSASQPCLAVILVGDDPASQLYVNLKRKAARKIGINFQLFQFSAKVKEADIIKKIRELNADKKISGIIVQLPLPRNFHTQKIINALDPQKDVDGFSAFGGHPQKHSIILRPVFPQAIVEILKSSRVKLQGKKATVIVNSKIFGKNMIAALENQGIKAKYLLFKELKNNLASIKKSEIVISAVGHPGFLQGKMLKKGALVVDGGITKTKKEVLGDVDCASVKKTAAFLSPIPGGVGPVTIACLLKNTSAAAKNLTEKCQKYLV